MDSMYAQHHDAAVTASEEVPAATMVAVENASPAVPTLAPVLALAAPVNMNQHFRVRANGRRHEMSWEITQGESFVVGDLDCLTLRYHGGGFHVIFSVHGGDGGVFKRAKFIVTCEGTEAQAPITRIFLMDLSERANKWMRDFIGQIMERMPGDTRGQMYNAVSTFCAAVSSNSIRPPPLINCDSTGQSTSIIGFTMTENSVDECPPCIHLPMDCYRLIRDRLDAFAILNFPLVCKLWAEVYAEKRRLQPGAPTLLTSPSVGGDWQLEHPDECHRGIFFIQNIILPRETFFVEVDDLRYSRWIGGKDEWLVTAESLGQCSFKLLNPITGACTRLVPEDVTAQYYIKRIQLCRTPDETNGHFAIAISPSHLAYNMAGSDQWFWLDNPIERYHMMNYTDAVLHRGEIVAVCSNGDLWSWDLEEQGGNPKLLFWSSICSERLDSDLRDFFLVPSLNDDNLLIVSPYGEGLSLREAGNRNTFRYQWNFCVHGASIHEVDIDAGSVKSDVRDIGDRALFLGPNYPFYVKVSVPSGDLKANHVYITDITNYDVAAINLSQGNLPGKVTFINYNGPENHPHQVPMWFRPAFP